MQSWVRSMERTSEYLERCLNNPADGSVPPLVQPRTPEQAAVWDWIGSLLLHQYVGLHCVFESDYRFSAQGERSMAEFLDDALCRSLIRAVPDMVKRMVTLERVMTVRSHSAHVQAYFEQSTRCYILGLSAAAVAIARACLEQALRETITIPHTTTLDLQDLITASARCKTLHGPHLQMAKEVQRIGNKVLHRESCTDSAALDAVLKVRALVEELYRPAD